MPIPHFLKSSKIAYVDQALVSGTNFFTAIVFARILGIEQFGIFSIFFIILILITTFHYSLCSAPMMTLAPQLSTEAIQAHYFRATNTIQVIVCIITAIVIFTLGSLSIGNLLPDNGISQYLIPFVLCVVTVPAQEWLRRHLFTIQSYLTAVIINLIRTAIYILLLLLLIMNDELSISSAYFAMAFSAGITYLIGISYLKLFYSFGNIKGVFQDNWNQGRHLVPAYLLEWVSLQGFLILAGLTIGSAAVGAIRAAQNIVGPLNIAYQALDNILPTEGAKRLAINGYASMLNYFSSVGRSGILYLSLLCIIVAVASPWIMALLYGESFRDYYTLVIWQLLSLLLGYSYKVASSFMRTIGITRPIFISTIIGVFVIVFITPPLSIILHEDGVMLAKAIAEICALMFLGFSVKTSIKTVTPQ